MSWFILFVMNICLAACYDFIGEVFETQFYTVSWLPRLKAPVMIAEKRKLLPDKCQLPLNHRLFSCTTECCEHVHGHENQANNVAGMVLEQHQVCACTCLPKLATDSWQLCVALEAVVYHK